MGVTFRNIRELSNIKTSPNNSIIKLPEQYDPITDTKLAKGKDILTDLEQQLVSLKKKFLYAAYNSLTLNAQSYIIKI